MLKNGKRPEVSGRAELVPCAGGCGGCDGKKPLPPCDDKCDKIDISCPCESDTRPCEPDCEERELLSCGCTMLFWYSKKGCKFGTKLVSLANESSLEASLDSLGISLGNIYLNTAAGTITADQLSVLPIFASNSTLQYSNGSSLTISVGASDIATVLASWLNAQGTAGYNQLTITYVYRLIGNDLADVTYTFSFTNSTTSATSVYYLLAQVHVIDCGLSVPIIDWAVLAPATPTASTTTTSVGASPSLKQSITKPATRKTVPKTGISQLRK